MEWGKNFPLYSVPKEKYDDQGRPFYVKVYRDRIRLANKEALSNGAEPTDLFTMMLASMASMLVEHAEPGKEADVLSMVMNLTVSYFDQLIHEQDMKRTE